MRTRHLARALILVVAVAVAAPAARAGDDFDAVVKFLRTQYGAEKRDGLPWIARVAINCGMFCAAPASSDPRMNETRANWNSGLRP